MHTKGPWTAIDTWAYSGDGSQYKVSMIVDEDNFNVLAKLGDERPANALLGAQAPAMLEALEGINAILAIWLLDPSKAPNTLVASIQSITEPVIRKARGHCPDCAGTGKQTAENGTYKYDCLSCDGKGE